MKAALIGYGYWGRIVERYIRDSAYFELTTICSAELEKHGIYTNDLTQVFQDPQIEAAFVCTPISTHFDICKKLLEAGKHVFCEKPTVKTPEEFQILKKMALDTKRILYTDYIYTVSPSLQKMKELLSEIGRIQNITGEIRQFGRFYEKDDVFEVLGIHLLSVVAFFVDSYPIQMIRYCNWDCETPLLSGKIEIQFDNGVTADLVCSCIYPDKIRRIVVQGTEGTLIFDMYGQNTIRYIPYKKQFHTYVMEEEKAWRFDEANNLVRTIAQFASFCASKMDRSNLDLSERVIEMLGSKKEVHQ